MYVCTYVCMCVCSTKPKKVFGWLRAPIGWMLELRNVDYPKRMTHEFWRPSFLCRKTIGHVFHTRFLGFTSIHILNFYSPFWKSWIHPFDPACAENARPFRRWEKQQLVVFLICNNIFSCRRCYIWFEFEIRIFSSGTKFSSFWTWVPRKKNCTNLVTNKTCWFESVARSS